MPTVNPEILVWARETAGLTHQEAVRKIGLGDSRGVAAVDRLIAMERGDKDPTRSNLVQMAKHYRRPLLVFYLLQPPPTANRGVDFRVISDTQSDRMNHPIDVLIRDMRSRQSMVRAVLEAEDEADSLSFVGTLRDLKGVLACTDQAVRHSVEVIHQVLGLESFTEYYEKPDPKAAFNLLRSKAEAAGVFVLLKGNLGSYHTDIPVKVFRGFIIADDIAPFVIINKQDSPSAQSFTLLHEMVHLLLNETGISGYGPGTKSEEFCNIVASMCLLPKRELEQINVKPNQDIAEQGQQISSFAQQRNLSHMMVAYRLLRSGSINQSSYEELSNRFLQEWEQNREWRHERGRKSSSGPDYYVVQRYNVGPALVSLTGRMMDSDALPTTKAAKILGVKPTQVGSMIASL